jgi:hypothetical protein
MLVSTTAGARPKIDVLVMDNGDRITCEIKQLNRNLLEVGTDYMKTVKIEWDQVQTVTSTQLFEVEDRDGTKYYGIIAADADTRALLVVSGMVATALEYQDVVRIAAINEKFLDRIKGAFDLGVTMKRANSEFGYNLGARATYRSRKFVFRSTLDSSTSHRSDVEDTSRNDLQFAYQRFLRSKWFAIGNTQFESNSELDLDLRTSIGGGIGRHMIQTNRSLLSLTAGLVGNREWYALAPEPENNLEAAIGASYQLFIFGDRETDLTVDLALLPSLTTWGRVRTNFGTSLRHELITDFYISFNGSATYDSQPPADKKALDPVTTDWSLWMSFGYTF